MTLPRKRAAEQRGHKHTLRWQPVQATIQHLEPLSRFRSRVTDLNRLYSPDDPLHTLVSMDGERWHLYMHGPDGRADHVAQGLAARKAIAAIHQGFPAGPMHEQATYLVRAFAGMRPFAEANHRTGWDYTAELVHHNGHELIGTVPEIRTLGSELWRIMEGAYPDGFHAGILGQRDEVWDYLAGYFHRRIA